MTQHNYIAKSLDSMHSKVDKMLLTLESINDSMRKKETKKEEKIG